VAKTEASKTVKTPTQIAAMAKRDRAKQSATGDQPTGVIGKDGTFVPDPPSQDIFDNRRHGN
jgi:hypothetical protein